MGKKTPTPTHEIISIQFDIEKNHHRQSVFILSISSAYSAHFREAKKGLTILENVTILGLLIKLYMINPVIVVQREQNI